MLKVNVEVASVEVFTSSCSNIVQLVSHQSSTAAASDSSQNAGLLAVSWHFMH